jgi:adenine-specific DNA-methyltransferase
VPKVKVKPAKKPAKPEQAESYKHPESESPMRPDVGTQPQFKKKKPPVTYRYDSSLSPALDWDGQNPAREQGEAAIEEISRGLTQINAGLQRVQEKEIRENLRSSAAAAMKAAGKLKAISKPFLNWAGKAERLSFDVPTLPLFVHERLSTKAIVETLSSHKRDKQQTMFELFGDPQRSITDQILKPYEHGPWQNRMILGDSLVVMNSLLQYEGLGGQVQMIYMDPPYGVEFGSNFQPFVRQNVVRHNDDDEMTREPETVQAYRDTWKLGIHSYLTYLRDRLLVARQLLTAEGSMFVQISTENLEYVSVLLDEVFGKENKIEIISFRKKTMPLGGTLLEGNCDYLLWYGKDKEKVTFHPLFVKSIIEGDTHWNYVELADGTRRALTREEIANHSLLPASANVYQLIGMYPTGLFETGVYDFEYEGVTYRLPQGKSWKTPIEGMRRLSAARRLQPYASGTTLRYVLKHSDYPVSPLGNVWQDTSAPPDKEYVVQTSNLVVERCLLMTTEPGDLVLDPTCGSGTTAYVAEEWGRRWITIDTSRVPLALARQRLLTATFPWYELKQEARGPAGGFVYKRKQNSKGEEVGGIVPHVTLKSIANNEPPDEEVLVDRPEVDNKITRVSGPFCVEATIPTPMDLESQINADEHGSGADQRESASISGYADRMLEVLRKSPVLRLPGNRTVTLRNIRPPAKTLSLSAEALVDATALGNGATLAEAVQEAAEKSGLALPLSQKPVAIVFGPENAAVAPRLVENAAHEAAGKNYAHLFVIGFAIDAKARESIENAEAVFGIRATYVSASPDLTMGDLLKNMRSSQIFSVCGLPEIRLHRKDAKDGRNYQVELLGFDVFDPITMETHHRTGDDVPAWFLDTDYNGLCFHVSQAFFPRTGAWESLKKALKGEYEESVWDHLAGTVSERFDAGEHRQIAVKVIDDRGNELMVIEKL